MKKLQIFAIVLLIIALILMVILNAIIAIFSNSGSQKRLAGSAVTEDESPERIEELMRLKVFGVPYDIVMMVTTYTSEDQEDALKKPFIFPALEFLVMTEEVKDFVHHHESNSSDDEDEDDEDEDEDEDEEDHSACGYETTAINTYEYKDAIKSYLGIGDEEGSSLNAGNLYEMAQAAADERCSSEQIRIIQFNPIAEAEYLAAIERCGVEKEEDRDGIFELYKVEYFKEWLEGAAIASGIEYGDHETIIVGYNSVHAAIRGMTAGSVSDFDGVFASPIDADWKGLVSCEYGTGYVGHTGMDLAVPVGTNIMAVAAGKVILAQSNPSGYGLYVVIDHGNGFATLYAHNSRLLVSAGDRVEQGQSIALSGNTGNVFPRPTAENPTAGAHLHLEFIVAGVPDNARKYLP